MILLDVITRFYGLFHNYKGVPFWVLTPLRKLTRSVANRVLPGYLSKHREIKRSEENRIIVSLTSFPARIDNVWQVIVCMLNQTLQPSEIILWLSKDQFTTSDAIPDSLRRLEGDIFKIRMVDGDIKSHKKYYYVAKEYPDDFVFLIDDDIYYSSTLLEKTWAAHINHPNNVICNYGYHIGYKRDGSFSEYNSWEPVHHNSQDDDLFFGSGGGTLFRPKNLYCDITNIKLAMELAPTADDIWLNAMVKKAGLKISLLKNGYLLPVTNKNNVTLSSLNVGCSQNDIQLAKVWSYYELK